jgi:hypothetical protein
MNQSHGHEIPLATQSGMPTTIPHILATGKLNYANYWTKYHPETHHCNMQKEFLTPHIVLEMLQMEQQSYAACTA